MTGHFEQARQAAAAHKEVPFPRTEFARRLERIREAMAAAEVDLLFLTSPESIYYVSGFQGEWYQAQSGRNFPPTSGIAVHVDHSSYIHFETPSEAILASITTVSDDLRIFPLESRRDGLAFILSELKAQGWLSGTVGLELSNYRPNPAIADRYRERFAEAGMGIVDATGIVRGVRRIKSRLEMDCIVEAARVADIGMTAARDAIRPGTTELEVWGEMVRAMAAAGGEFSGIIPPVMSGLRSNCSHPLASRKAIAKGERVNVDLCGVFNRYHANICRGFWVGEPPKAVQEFHDRTVAVFDIIEPLLKPGLRVKLLMEAVTDYYRQRDLLQHAYWSGGYELGIAFPPDWVGEFVYDNSFVTEDDVFDPMSVVNHECVFFGPEASGLCFTIDTLLFDETSARIASAIPRQLDIVSA